jgi:hypothetical protein
MWGREENDDGTAEDILAPKQCEIQNPRHFSIEAAAWDDASWKSFGIAPKGKVCGKT